MNPREKRLKQQVHEIEAIRQALGVTLEELAERVYVQAETMRKYARGYQPASARLMQALHALPTRVAEEPAVYRVTPGTKTKALAQPPPPHTTSDDGHFIGWSIIVRALADRLSTNQIAEAMSEVLAHTEIDEGVRNAAAQILISAQLPKLKR
jgi:transcriptional regulator with XRE-family HTH domain